jgi:predicted RNA-binding Zn-ribbon protein involved in translation (DUF1610 family)
MQHSGFIPSFINQAREEIEDEAQDHPREVALLQRLLAAIDSGSDGELATTVTQLKAEVDALPWPIHTILPDLVEALYNKLTGKPPYKTIRCPNCDGAIPMPIDTGVRFGGRYTCPECHNDVILPGDEIGMA